MAAGRAIDELASALVTVRHSDLDDRLIERAADCVLDVAGAAAAGRDASGVEAMQTALQGSMSSGPCRVWRSDLQMTSAAAATINAMAATALDIDDGHRMAAGHPGAAVITAAVAVAEERDASVEEFLVAVVLGYEASIRVALARQPAHYTSTVSGRWSGVGAAVAAGRLRGYSPEKMAQAILLSEQQAPRLSSAMLHGFAGSTVKEGIAWSVLTGLMSADLAAAGFLAYPDTFEQGELYDPNALIADLADFTAIDGLFFKPFACCRWIHAALDGLQEIMSTHSIAAHHLRAIEIATFRRAVELGNHVAPKTEMEAQFSIPFCLGAMAVGGAEALAPLDLSMLSDRGVRSVAEKTKVVFDDEMESAFPARAAAVTRVRYEGGYTEKRVDAPFGDPTNPMSRGDLQSKFRRLTRHTMDQRRQDEIITLMEHLHQLPSTSARQAFGLLQY
ncbi:MAG: MmgE/PrpD family protein [Alphaproteobacteria bacterium]|nr:MmgE/PrpD family protein [Alphaproteobacteria bacterium]